MAIDLRLINTGAISQDSGMALAVGGLNADGASVSLPAAGNRQSDQ